MKLYLIDGTSYIYRAYHAIRGLSNSKGFPTNAIYGFTNILLRLIRERKPDAVAITFDTPEPTTRHELFEEYKANRPPPPDDLVKQISPIMNMVNAFNIPAFIMPGYEADDILAAIAKREALKGTHVYIITGDKDMLQVIGPNIRIYDPMKDIEYDSEYVLKRFGVSPERIPEIMALTGDSVDNIPGVKGIGEKTASELLQKFSSLDELIKDAESIEKERVKHLILKNIDSLKLSFKLAALNLDIPVEYNPEDLNIKEPDWIKLKELFIEFELTSFLKLLPKTDDLINEYETIRSPDRLKEALSQSFSEIAIDTETTGDNPLIHDIVGISFAVNINKGYYIPLKHKSDDEPQLSIEDVVGAFSPVLHDNRISKIGHNIKFDIHILRRNSLDIKGYLFDTMVASYLLNPNRSNHNLKNASLEHLSYNMMSYKELMGKRKTFDEVSVKEASRYSIEDAVAAFKLREILFKKLESEELLNLYDKIEMPLIYILHEIEKNGIKIDTDKLNKISLELTTLISNIESRIYSLSDENFNINSPKQLRRILFEKLKLKPGKKTKSGYSTDISVLETLAAQHPLPEEILKHRTLTKLKNTYVDALPEYINPYTQRLHTSFNQTVTSTGRLSSSSPNLQNIPIRGEWGEEIRSAFISENSSYLVSADYSQIELRILAHLSEDTELMNAFIQNIDVHSKTAMEIFNISSDKVTPDMRRIAKSVNFGIIYGISPYGLSETLKISRDDAKYYIDTY